MDVSIRGTRNAIRHAAFKSQGSLKGVAREDITTACRVDHSLPLEVKVVDCLPGAFRRYQQHNPTNVYTYGGTDSEKKLFTTCGFKAIDADDSAYQQIPVAAIESILREDSAVVILALNLTLAADQEIVQTLHSRYPGSVIVIARFENISAEQRTERHEFWQSCLGDYILYSEKTDVLEIIQRVLKAAGGADTYDLFQYIDAAGKEVRLQYALRYLSQVLTAGLSDIYNPADPYSDLSARLTILSALYFRFSGYNIDDGPWNKIQRGIDKIVKKFNLDSKHVRWKREAETLSEKLGALFRGYEYHTTKTAYWLNVETLAEVCNLFYDLIYVLHSIESPPLAQEQCMQYFLTQFEEQNVAELLTNNNNSQDTLLQIALEQTWVGLFNEFHPGHLT